MLALVAVVALVTRFTTANSNSESATRLAWYPQAVASLTSKGAQHWTRSNLSRSTGTFASIFQGTIDEQDGRAYYQVHFQLPDRIAAGDTVDLRAIRQQREFTSNEYGIRSSSMLAGEVDVSRFADGVFNSVPQDGRKLGRVTIKSASQDTVVIRLELDAEFEQLTSLTINRDYSLPIRRSIHADRSPL